MTKKELIKKLLECEGHYMDCTGSHIEADELLIEYINDEEVRRAYEKITKWYAIRDVARHIRKEDIGEEK